MLDNNKGHDTEASLAINVTHAETLSRSTRVTHGMRVNPLVLHDFLFSPRVPGEGAELVAVHQQPLVISLVPALEVDQHHLLCLSNFHNFRGVPGKT